MLHLPCAETANIPKEASFQAALARTAEAHCQEVRGLHEENRHLRDELKQLRDYLKSVQASNIFARFDEPKMQSVAQCVAADLASWIDSGSPDMRARSELRSWLGELPLGTGALDKGRHVQRVQERLQEMAEPPAAPSEAAARAGACADAAPGQGRNSHSSRPFQGDAGYGVEELHQVVEACVPRTSVDLWPNGGEGVGKSGVEFALPERTGQRPKSQSSWACVPRTSMESRPNAGEGVGKSGVEFALPERVGQRPKSQSSWAKSIEAVDEKRRSANHKFQEVLVSKEGLMLTQKTIGMKQQTKRQYWFAKKVSRGTVWPGKWQDSSARLQGGWWFVKRIARHPAFDGLCTIMILFNSSLIGVSTQMLIITGRDEDQITAVLGHFCTCFFIVELVLRLLAERMQFITSLDMRWWNLFDATLVSISVVEILVTPEDNSIGGAVKTIKMLRIFRLLRVFRFFKELNLLTRMVMDSLRSLANALMMLVIITYVFAICFTQQAALYMNDTQNAWPQPKSQDVAKYFGSLWQTIYTLIQAMLNGVSWGVLSDALKEINTFPFALFFFYVFFMMLAVLNIITGVFVDNAVETAKTQRDFMIQKETELKEMYVKEMRKLFSEIDGDDSGTINLAEVKENLNDPSVKSYFQLLGLDPADSERLFALLDSDGTGDVGVDDFINGCLRLKGQARSIDIYELLLKTNRVEMRLKDLTDPRKSRWSFQSLEACRGFGLTEPARRPGTGPTGPA